MRGFLRLIPRSRWALALALAACQSGAYGPWPRPLTPGTVRRYPCRFTTTPPVIDGVLDDPQWSNAPWSEPFVDIEGTDRPLPRYATWMKMLWDDKNLYIAAYLEEPDLWGTIAERDGRVFLENDFEIFIDPDGDRDSYYEFQINVLGTVFDLYMRREPGHGGAAHGEWNCEGMDGAIVRDGTLNDPNDVDMGWTVELKVPFKCLRPPKAVADDAAENVRNGDTPSIGETWRMNFQRVEWPLEKVGAGYVRTPDGREDNWVWTPQWSRDIHQLAHWGEVAFTK